MNKKLFCSDLDDTLLRRDKSLSEANKKAIEELIDAGHSFAFVTGRSINGGLMVFEQLGLSGKNCYMACFHGNALYDIYNKKILGSHGMDSDFVIKLLHSCESHGIYAQTYTTEAIFIPQYDSTAERFLAITKENYELIGDHERLRPLSLPKVIVIDYHNPERLIDFREEMMPLQEGRANSFFSCPQYLEYCDLGRDKGVGLCELAKVLGFDMADVIAAGDERNDIPMLKAAGVDASAVVKTTVFITDMNDFPKVNEVYAGYFVEPYPARSCVGVASLPKGALVEIEVVARLS